MGTKDRLDRRLQRHWQTLKVPHPAAREGEDEARMGPEAEAWRTDNAEIPDDGIQIVWDSSTHSHANGKFETNRLEWHEDVASVKHMGNQAMQKGDAHAAIGCYSHALEMLQTDDSAVQELVAVLLNNRAAAHLCLKDYTQAQSDAECASSLMRTWSKPCYRLAQALLGQGLYADAVAAARRGEQLCLEAGDLAKDFASILDRIAIVAALHGSFAGFDGRTLHVRSAGEDAWLGGKAPFDPRLDEELPPPGARFPGLPLTAETSSKPDAILHANHTSELMPSQRLSFRSVKEAVDAAQDGDRIVLLRGIHNGCAETVTIKKRLLITGEGQLEEATVDFRGNTPAFRIEGNAVLDNIFIDMSGYCAAVTIHGKDNTQPLLENCKIICSGSDAIHVSCRACPIIRGCEITGKKKCGIRVWNAAGPQIISCKVQGCGQQALKLFHTARAYVQHSYLRHCGAEGVVAMGKSSVSLESCVLEANKGPALDISSEASTNIKNSVLKECVGGVWAWDRAEAVVVETSIAGGESMAVVAEDDARIKCTDCVIDGNLHATDLAWSGLDLACNKLMNTNLNADLPPLSEPFVYIPNPYQ